MDELNTGSDEISIPTLLNDPNGDPNATPAADNPDQVGKSPAPVMAAAPSPTVEMPNNSGPTFNVYDPTTGLTYDARSNAVTGGTKGLAAQSFGWNNAFGAGGETATGGSFGGYGGIGGNAGPATWGDTAQSSSDLSHGGADPFQATSPTLQPTRSALAETPESGPRGAGLSDWRYKVGNSPTAGNALFSSGFSQKAGTSGRNSPIGFEIGGVVPGPRAIQRDIVPIMAKPGEIVLNQEQQRQVDAKPGLRSDLARQIDAAKRRKPRFLPFEMAA
jgi:hypothetical protein